MDPTPIELRLRCMEMATKIYAAALQGGRTTLWTDGRTVRTMAKHLEIHAKTGCAPDDPIPVNVSKLLGEVASDWKNAL